jgi:hypothetical protein
MPDNYQELPGGLIGFRQTPHEVFIHTDASNYNVVNIDQVINAQSDFDIVFDTSILTDGKMFYIKNAYIKEVVIDGGGATIDGMNTFTIKIGEAITLLFKKVGLSDVFYILGKYKAMSPIVDFIVEAGASMENGDTTYQNDGIEFPPSVYIDGLLLTYEIVTDRRYVSYNYTTRTVTINNGGVNEGENVQIFT